MKDAASGVLPFVSQLVSSLAWPVTVLTCVFLLRKHLLDMLPFVRSVKYSDVEIKFGKDVADLARSTGNASLPPSALSSGWDEVEKLVHVRPRTAIRLAFRRLEEAVLQTAQAADVDLSDAASGMPMVVGAILLNKGAMSTEQYDMLSRLRSLLNEAETAPPDSIRSESAAEFMGLAFQLAASLSGRSL